MNVLFKEGVKVLTEPLSEMERKHISLTNDRVFGCIKVELNTLIDYNLESIFDIFSMKLIGTDTLEDISYEIVGIDYENQKLILYVEGHDPEASELFEEEKEVL